MCIKIGCINFIVLYTQDLIIDDDLSLKHAGNLIFVDKFCVRMLVSVKGKGKMIPLQTLCGPEDG